MIGEYQKIKKSAFVLLAKREHSVHELREKLLLKAYKKVLVEKVLDEFIGEAYVSDMRYVEMMLRHRFSRGSGPVRVMDELRQKQVSENLIQNGLQEFKGDWCQLAQSVRQKKFGDWSEADFKTKAKQMRFLAARGFEMSQIQGAFSPPDLHLELT